MYFDYPLEQGLRHPYLFAMHGEFKYFDYPLEQGLRLHIDVSRFRILYFDYPLEQGLRHQ